MKPKFSKNNLKTLNFSILLAFASEIAIGSKLIGWNKKEICHPRRYQ